MSYVPLSKQTAAYKLFHYPYMWIFAENEAWDLEEVGYVGRVTTGDDEWDRVLSTTRSPKYITVAEAAALAGKGVSMSLSDPKDAVAIYHFICEHLNNWLVNVKDNSGSMLGKVDVPLTGLREFNALAKNLVRIGRCHGLIDLFDPYKTILDRRAYALGARQEVDIAKFEHSDAIINSIAGYVAYRKKERSKE